MNVNLAEKPSFQTVMDEEFMVLFRPLDAKHRYNPDVVQALAAVFNPANDVEYKNLNTYIYIGRQQARKERQDAYRDKMIADGWMVCNKEAVQKAVDAKKKLEVSATKTTDWLTQQINQVFKPFIHPESGAIYLMKPRARTRGILLQRLENAFCRLV